VYTGNGFTVVDSYSCGSGNCGGFTVTTDATSHELAAPVLGCATVDEAGNTCKTVRATPAHLVMTMHALTFGALAATSNLFSGDSDFVSDFKKSAKAGAETVTPVGASVLSRAFGPA
jgi:hypothetical protein